MCFTTLSVVNNIPNYDLSNLKYLLRMRTGKFVTQLSGDVKYKAFIPNDLPFNLKLDDSIYDLLSKADISLGRLDGIAETLPNVNFFIIMYIRKEATLSSQIEGTQATFSDLLKVESKIEDSEVHNDVDEIVNYVSALNYGLERLENFPLSLPLIKEIHDKLLKGVRGDSKSPGEFRKSQNWVGGYSINSASYIPPPAHEMNLGLNQLEKFIHKHSPLPILIKTALIHSQFETLHPFLDGNGRLGRLLITFYLCSRGILNKPLLYLSEYFKKNRNEYYKRLNATRTHDDIEGWLKFFLKGIVEISDSAVNTIRKIITLSEDNKNKLIQSGRRNEKGISLLNHLYSSPFVTYGKVEKIANIKNPNAISLVRKFSELGILKEVSGRKRYKIFAYQDYIDLFY